jgi:hypothetical protein
MTVFGRDGSSDTILFAGARTDAPAAPERALPGVSHYAQGNDPSHWIWDVPHFAAVRYRGIYPGVDLLYRASDKDIEFDLVVSPGAVNYGTGLVSMATPPDSPQTLIISTNSDILIYDRDQPRLFDAAAAGFPTFQGYSLLFAGQKRIYGNQGYTALHDTGFCLTWLNYDAFGISTSQSACGPMPPEVQDDHGVTYVSDGVRNYVFSMPSPELLPYGSLVYYAADPANRQAWEIIPSAYQPQLFQYNMDTEQLQFRLQVNYSYIPLAAVLYPAGNGAVLMVQGNSVLLIP